jgi:hypothetical protein
MQRGRTLCAGGGDRVHRRWGWMWWVRSLGSGCWWWRKREVRDGDGQRRSRGRGVRFLVVKMYAMMNRGEGSSVVLSRRERLGVVIVVAIVAGLWHLRRRLKRATSSLCLYLCLYASKCLMNVLRCVGCCVECSVAAAVIRCFRICDGRRGDCWMRMSGCDVFRRP